VEIKVGDLVMVVRPNECGCGPDESCGRIFTALRVEHVEYSCGGCLKSQSQGWFVYDSPNQGYAMHRLRRINPLDETQETENYEVMTK
jgi:hypothetical protein